MSEDMQQDAIDCAAAAMEKFNIEKDIAVSQVLRAACCALGGCGAAAASQLGTRRCACGGAHVTWMQSCI